LSKISNQKTNSKSRRITIGPITRLEGEAKIEIFLDKKGNVEDTYFQIVELRGFEKFCEGRPVEELPRITSRICGVCSGAHHIAACKALDGVYGVNPPSAGKKLRELFYCAHSLHSHLAHVFALAAPDLVLGFNAPKEKRNIFGVIEKLGLELGKKVLIARGYAQKIQAIIGGSQVHATGGMAGGLSKPLNEDSRKEIEKMSEELLEFAKISLDLFKKIISDNKEIKEILDSKDYSLQTYYMGMVDDQEKVNLYDGDIKVVDSQGKEFIKFKAKDYLSHIEERVEPWTYVKFPYLKNIGWKGLVEGMDNGIYRVGPLARLNVAKGMATPLANQACQEMYELLGGKPLHSALALNWARVVEIVYIAERINELVKDKEITDKKVRTIPEGIVGEGVGCVEASRGTLFHHYIADEQGIAKKVNFIVATTQNNGPICMSIKKAAQRVIKNFKVDDGLLNLIEVAFRAYDPCLACASHCLPGHMAMKANIYNSDKKLINEIIRKEKVR